jgi:hypothetical protein
MPSPDALRWNERYRQERSGAFERPRSFLIECTPYLPGEGKALDLAMGLGGNAGYLRERGLHVFGVDISEVGVRLAKKRHPELAAVVADLNRFYIPPNTFDLIVNFFYLQRDLWPAIEAALRPGGTLVYQTLTQDMRSIHPDIEPQYLLAPGELRGAFPGLEILLYREGWEDAESDHRKAAASLVARKYFS